MQCRAGKRVVAFRLCVMIRTLTSAYAWIRILTAFSLIFKVCVTIPLGRALDWQSRGQEFDPPYLHHSIKKSNTGNGVRLLFCVRGFARIGGGRFIVKARENCLPPRML